MCGGERNEGSARHSAPPERGGDPGHPGRRRPWSRRFYLCTGYAGLVLGGIGAVLPLVPTVPFLLLAAWAFSRSDPRLLERLRRHARLGPLLRDWESERAIPTRAKAAAVLMMAGSWTVVAAGASTPLLPALLGTVLGAVCLYVVTRPAPRGRTIEPVPGEPDDAPP